MNMVSLDIWDDLIIDTTSSYLGSPGRTAMFSPHSTTAMWLLQLDICAVFLVESSIINLVLGPVFACNQGETLTAVQQQKQRLSFALFLYPLALSISPFSSVPLLCAVEFRQIMYTRHTWFVLNLTN